MDLISILEKKIVQKVVKLGSRLHEMKSLLDCNRFDSIIEQIRKNKTSKGGRPNKNNVLMLKVVVLQKWFGLSDVQLERDIYDCASFRDFLNLKISDVPDLKCVSIPVPSIPTILGLSPLFVSSKSFLINSKSKLEIQLFNEDFLISYFNSNQEAI
jgi:hypothetical protein